MKNEEQVRTLFGISLTDRPKWHQFLICSSGFFFGYLVNGICEVFYFSSVWFLTKFGFLLCFISFLRLLLVLVLDFDSESGFFYFLLLLLEGFCVFLPACYSVCFSRK